MAYSVNLVLEPPGVSLGLKCCGSHCSAHSVVVQQVLANQEGMKNYENLHKDEISIHLPNIHIPPYLPGTFLRPSTSCSVLIPLTQ